MKLMVICQQQHALFAQGDQHILALQPLFQFLGGFPDIRQVAEFRAQGFFPCDWV